MLAGMRHRRACIARVAVQGGAGSVPACGLSRLVSATGLLVHALRKMSSF